MNNQDIQKTIEILKRGGIVIYPTDTAYGIGCRMDNIESVKRIYDIKKRSYDNALLVLVDSVEMAEKYVEIPSEVKTKLVDKHWPGGLTIFLKIKKEKVPGIVTASSEILAVRLPDHKEIRHIIHEVGVPIIATSANISGQDTPYQYSDLDKEIVSHVDFVLHGECTYEKESTIIDTTVLPWKIIRLGAVEIKN